MSASLISDELAPHGATYKSCMNILDICRNAKYRDKLLQADRTAAFEQVGLVGPEALQIARLGFFPLPGGDVACFSCGFKCRPERIGCSIDGAFNRPNCPLQAARRSIETPMWHEHLEQRDSELPTPQQLDDILSYLNSIPGQVLMALFPGDSVIFCLDWILVKEGQSLRSLSVDTVSRRLLADDLSAGSLFLFPALDEASTFASEFRQLVRAGPTSSLPPAGPPLNISQLANLAVQAS